MPRWRPGTGEYAGGIVALAAGLVAALWPGPSNAVNGLRPRVVTDFGDVPCLVRVDRSEGPVFHIEYSVSEEDLEVDPIDVPSGRTHQFLALHQHREELLPTWITWADVDEASAYDLANPAVLTDADVFETSPAWPAQTWLRITPDSPRIPISFDAASAGVDWDTSDIPVGPWRVMGYTWDPEINWTEVRDGLVMVVDGDDPASYPPGAHVRVSPGSSMIREGETLVLDVCLDVMPGSTMEIAWAPFRAAGDLEWEVVDAEPIDPVDRGAFQVEAVVPFDLGEEPAVSYRARVRVQDPTGRSFTAFSATTFIVLENGDPLPEEPGPDGACACRGRPSGTSRPPLLFLLLLGLRRRRLPTSPSRADAVREQVS